MTSISKPLTITTYLFHSTPYEHDLDVDNPVVEFPLLATGLFFLLSPEIIAYNPAMTNPTTVIQPFLDDARDELAAKHPELILDKHHPDNHEFFRQQRSLQRLIVHTSSKMKSRHIEVAKRLLKGERNTDIEEQMGLPPGSVSRMKGRKDVNELIGLLRHLQALHEGPSVELRKRMLYEIAVDNQQLEPKVSIAAVQEMNRMDGVGKEKTDTSINITINNQQLPRGALDG